MLPGEVRLLRVTRKVFEGQHRQGLNLARARVDCPDETIASAGQSLDVPRLFGAISQYGTDLVHAKVDAPVEVHKRVVGPKA